MLPKITPVIHILIKEDNIKEQKEKCLYISIQTKDFKQTCLINDWIDLECWAKSLKLVS